MKIEIIKEFSRVYNKILYRVYVENILIDTFNALTEAKEYIEKNKENWKLKPEVVWSEEI